METSGVIFAKWLSKVHAYNGKNGTKKTQAAGWSESSQRVFQKKLGPIRGCKHQSHGL